MLELSAQAPALLVLQSFMAWWESWEWVDPKWLWGLNSHSGFEYFVLWCSASHPLMCTWVTWGLVKMQILIQKIWVQPVFTCLTSSQVMPLLLNISSKVLVHTFLRANIGMPPSSNIAPDSENRHLKKPELWGWGSFKSPETSWWLATPVPGRPSLD